MVKLRGIMERSRAFLCTGTVGLATLLAPWAAVAAEFYQTATPGGVTDIRAAELPRDSGFYGIGALTFVHYKDFNDAQGNPIFPDTNQHINLGSFGGMYIFDDPVFGGRLAASAITGVGQNNLRVTNLPIGPGGTGLKNDNSGLFDTYVDLFWQRSWYNPPTGGPPTGGMLPLPSGFSFGLGLGLTLPSGKFDGTRVGNPGFNNYIISPNIAFTYRTAPIFLDGTEFSTRIFYNHNTTRSDSTGGFDYRDGDNIIADFAVTERFQRYQFGLAGSYIHQIEDDEGNPAMPVPDGRRVRTLRLGPIIAIDFPEVGMTVKAKALFDTISRNAPTGNAITISLLKKF